MNSLPIDCASRIRLGLVALLGLASTAQAADPTRIDPRLQDAIAAKKGGRHSVLIEPVAAKSTPTRLLAFSESIRPEQRPSVIYQQLRRQSEASQRGLRTWLQERGIAYRSFVVVDRVAAQLDAAEIAALSDRSDVARLHFDAPMKALAVEPGLAKDACGGNSSPTWGQTKIGAPTVWADYGVRGAGVVVAGQDTGYDWTHPVLQPQYLGWNGSGANHDYHWHDAIHPGHPNGGTTNACGFDLTAPCDDQQHGTHTMGTMVGSNRSDRVVGIAPDARWIGCRNMNNGWGVASSYIECFDWFLAPTDLAGNNPDPQRAPHVINNSWGCATTAQGEDCDDDDLSQFDIVIDNLTAAGILVVASAGNAGSSCSTVNSPPAMSENALVVGNTRDTDAINGSSSRGPVTRAFRNLLKPDVSAPGTTVCSSVPGGGYASFSGTSMAGPHVAGLAALIMSANPALKRQPLVVKQLIMETALGLTSGQTCGVYAGANVPNAVFGHGRIQAVEAIQRAAPMYANSFEDVL